MSYTKLLTLLHMADALSCLILSTKELVLSYEIVTAKHFLFILGQPFPQKCLGGGFLFVFLVGYFLVEMFLLDCHSEKVHCHIA